MFQLADIFVVPSRFEPWGLVVNEAMAAGLPVVVSERAGCAPDLIEDNETGVLIPAEDPQALCRAIEALAIAPEIRHRIAAKGRERIRGWTLANAASITVSAWETALNR